MDGFDSKILFTAPSATFKKCFPRIYDVISLLASACKLENSCVMLSTPEVACAHKLNLIMFGLSAFPS